MRAVAATFLTATLTLGTSVGVAGQGSATDPGVPVGPDASYFTGTMECEWEHTGTEHVDGVEQYAEHFDCAWEATDPRVAGTEELAIVTYGSHGAAFPWSAVGTLTNDEGSWRGSGQGLADRTMFNHGEMAYVGEGAYEGLTMHYYVAGPNSEMTFAGWIAPAAD